ncbi:amino acid racemase [Micromonospora sp. NPDC050980]|uniref:aspartate/glutamate racemase family protein n=1 Tax=Micromonospora sp. NPDC050980 TaxID=3155161 RepID=UPI0033FCF5CA
MTIIDGQPAPRVLGVLGGMGPAAGVEFLRAFVDRWPGTRDQDHPRVVLHSEPGIHDRTAALLGTGPDPTQQIRAALQRLAASEVDLVAVPCNTAFAFIDRFAHDLPVPVVHTVAATVVAAVRSAPAGAWLLATRGAVSAQIYQARARAVGYRLLVPDQECQRRVQGVVDIIKAGAVDRAVDPFLRVVRDLHARHRAPLLFGCTELPLVWRAAGQPVEVVDSVAALADECVARLRAGGSGGDLLGAALGTTVGEYARLAAAGTGRRPVQAGVPVPRTDIRLTWGADGSDRPKPEGNV